MRRSWLLVLALAGCSNGPHPMPSSDAQPPIAARRPHDVVSPNGTRTDPYYWLRDDTRKDPEVLAYLKAENAYTAQMFAPIADLEAKLFEEVKSHLAPDLADVPVFEDGYYSARKFVPDQEQPVYVRRKGSLTAPEEIVLDCNELAKGTSYYEVAAVAVSHDGRYVAWVDDTVGRRQYQLHIKDLTTDTVLADTATNVSNSLAWANDHRTVFYIGKDATTLREDRVIAHRIGSTGDDPVVYREPDEGYYVSVAPTKSRRYVQIGMDAATTREVRLIDADHPSAEPRVFLPRQAGTFYEINHVGDRFVMRTNDGAVNFRVVEVADGKERDRGQWKDLVVADADEVVEGFAAYRKFVAVTLRRDGYDRVAVIAPGVPLAVVDVPEPVSTTTVIDTPDVDAGAVRYMYGSLVTPDSIYERDVATGATTLLQQLPVPGYDPSQYTSEATRARAPDGAEVPISIVYKKGTKLDGTAPLVIWGYGSHAISVDPLLGISRLLLIDRGWVMAFAHIRGGQELGRAWFDGGRLMNKWNTFTDYIAATEHLVKQKYGAPDKVCAWGASAGGLVMGVVANKRPDLYRCIVASVPFVDVLTTMLDESIPLTTNEYDIWGNPSKDKAAYDYILSYSPYDNIVAQGYPTMLVTTSLWDSQVQYFEPAKWVAKLRATKTDKNLLLLDTDMDAGHTGKSGRADRYKIYARSFAFMIHAIELPDSRRK